MDLDLCMGPIVVVDNIFGSVRSAFSSADLSVVNSIMELIRSPPVHLQESLLSSYDPFYNFSFIIFQL